jgi:glutathione S-transferase
MTSIRLFGTLTSPYVRRVRIVAHELAIPCELVDTSTPTGTRELLASSPIWKVPAANIDGELVFDSHVITELLLVRHDPNERLRPLPVDDLAQRNMITVIDGALDALINVLYLTRDGVDAQVPYVRKQKERAASAMEWIEQRLEPVGERLGLPEIALATALGWMRFRAMYPIEQHAVLVRWFEDIDARPSFAATRPPA